MLPVLLCACHQNQKLVHDDPAYHVTPRAFHFDDEQISADELTRGDEQRITTVNYSMAPEPIRLRDRQPLVHWDMTLQEVIFHSLANSKIIRQGGQFLSPNNSLLRSPEGTPTIYDQAIQSTGVLFGQRGEQAALSEFDTQFTTRFLWGNSSTIQNNRNTGLQAGTALIEDTGQFQSSLQKSLFSGGQVGLSHSWNYSSNNNTVGRLFPSAYEGNLRAEYRQPLLAGAGSEYSMIAGPISDNIQGVTGVQQGILIARINNALAMADFELSVIGFLRDVEMQYWKLHLAYQTHQIELESLRDAKRILGIVEARQRAPGGDLARLVEAREGTLQSEQRVLEALDAVYSTEGELRLLMGFTLQNERMIHPIDAPLTVEVKHDWSSSLGSALARRPELRRQKASVKSAELQLLAAENLNRPRLDLLASGQSNGFGDNLLGSRSSDRTPQRIGNAYDRLVRGNETGWNLGIEYSQPLGLRFANQQAKNHELKLAKAMKILEAQEAEVLLQLTAAFQAVDRTYLAMQTQDSLVKNAEDRMAAAEADYNSNKEGRSYLDLDTLNRARDIYTQAVVKRGQAQLEYTMALTDIEYRCGRLLDQHNVLLGSTPDSAMSAPSSSAHDPGSAPVERPPLTPPSLPSDEVEPLPQPPEVVPPSDNDITIIDRSVEDVDFVSTLKAKAPLKPVTPPPPVTEPPPAAETQSLTDDWKPHAPPLHQAILPETLSKPAPGGADWRASKVNIIEAPTSSPEVDVRAKPALPSKTDPQ